MGQIPSATSSHPAVARYSSAAPSASNKFLTDEQLRGIENRIICGDMVEVLSSFPSNSVDLVHTSPPYNIDRPYESSPSDRNPHKEYADFLNRAITQIKRVLRPGGSIFWQTGYTQDGGASREIVPIDLLSYEIFRANPDPFILWDRIIWRYWGGHAFTKKFTNKHETILWFVKDGVDPIFRVGQVREKAKEYDKRNNFWGRNPGNVWEVDRVAFGSAEQTSHIAVFPEELTERIVRACSELNSLVLDPFSGSGTVPKVAHGLGRRWIGIEISPAYAKEAAIRVGFQQPSEADSLISELIKHLAFEYRNGILSFEEVHRRLYAWANPIQTKRLREVFENDVGSVFYDGSGRNPTKRNIWTKYDQILNNKQGHNSIALVDRLLINCYKLRQHFNGVTRYKTALAAVEVAVAHILDVNALSYLQKVTMQEPSSFGISGDRLELLSPRRVVGVNTLEFNQPINQWQQDAESEPPQGRML